MAVRRDKTGVWRYRKVVRMSDGTRPRISGTPSQNTRLAAERAERAAIERALNPQPEKKEVPTFKDWFNGRFWEEWVIARRNKASEVESKRRIYDYYLDDVLGSCRLNEIDDGTIAQLRAKLLKKELSEKTINNVLAVISKALHYAKRVRLIDFVPEVGFFKVERPEIEFYEFEAYQWLLEAAKRDREPEWYAALCLAGDGGLRIGEIKALKWQEDVDLVAGTITVQRQVRKDQVGTPKGRTRRTIPMTATLLSALKSLSEIRIGYVIRNLDGSAKGDQQARSAVERIMKRAGLPLGAPNSRWHKLRHTFASHAAMFGINPWTLMTWMGHKSMSETLRYVHVANAHKRPLPESVVLAAGTELDPDRRILSMLGGRGKGVAKEEARAEGGT